MKIAVIDDEKPQADILYSICNAYFGGHKQNVQIDCFPDGIAFFNSFKENTYKIAFVDIFMEKKKQGMLYVFKQVLVLLEMEANINLKDIQVVHLIQMSMKKQKI